MTEPFCETCGGPLTPDCDRECRTCIARRGARQAAANIRPTKRGDQ